MTTTASPPLYLIIHAYIPSNLLQTQWTNIAEIAYSIWAMPICAALLFPPPAGKKSAISRSSTKHSSHVHLRPDMRFFNSQGGTSIVRARGRNKLLFILNIMYRYRYIRTYTYTCT
ncbi:hypothetical protein BDBG_17733 [Blastomyces gilchristii SLH14081]|uniref:Uncharacterized protein n=1 Tax=Blastomyces gilchristii (strain SLH14081) TaxID=559298 RepID=A0A179UYT0_BLAGS|nr:uncharacterized protein BDBG_17733 [Blastomyces gilchristii SLH14081]OAT12990.1 hypothetical protein BDBG_17733 [Blastomyces gilchristii SLH14081]